MVSVRAIVSSLAMDKSTNGEGVKRIQVKRNVGGGDGGARTGVSPRARSPARTREIEAQNPVSLSRSNSRKAEHSPYRRNPLSVIDTNVISQVFVHLELFWRKKRRFLKVVSEKKLKNPT